MRIFQNGSLTRTRTALAVAFLLLATACGGSAFGGAVGADTAARVADTRVSMDELEEMVSLRLDAQTAEGQTLTDDQRRQAVAQAQLDALSLLVQSALFEEAAERRDIEITDEDVEAVMEEQAALLGGRDILLERIEALGLTEERARETILRTLAIQTALQEDFGADLTEDDLRQAYQERAANFTEVTLSRIRADDQQTAQQIVDELEQGADFAELARERSTDQQSAAQGGELGELRLANLPPNLADAVANAEVGDIVGPVESQGGFEILRLEDRRVIPFSEAREGLEQELSQAQQQQGYQQFLSELAQEADVRVNSRLGRWDPQQGIVPAEPLIPSQQGGGLGTPGLPGLPGQDVQPTAPPTG